MHFPRYGRHADELCVTELAAVIWAVQMSTVEFHPWNSRRADTQRPDEWRIDVDPGPRCGFATVRRVAHVVHEILGELGVTGWPKTSGGNGLHIYVRIEPRWGFAELRRAAHAFAREVERRVPDEVTTTWWRKDRDPAICCSSTTTRTPATTPPPAPTPSAACQRPPFHPHHLGRDRPGRPAPVHHRHRACPLRRTRRPPPGHRRHRLPPGYPARLGRTIRARLVPSLAKDLVHHLGTLGERGADLVAVDRLGGCRTLVSGEQGNAFHGNAVGG